MNRIIIILLIIVVIFAAMAMAVFIYMPEENNKAKIEVQNVAVENTINEVENVTENNTNMVETNANEERISPNVIELALTRSAIYGHYFRGNSFPAYALCSNNKSFNPGNTSNKNSLPA